MNVDDYQTKCSNAKGHSFSAKVKGCVHKHCRYCGECQAINGCHKIRFIDLRLK